LIGETGLGKSTWINFFANYCKFHSLEEAVQAGGLFPIPCYFETADPQTGHMISISSEGTGVTPVSKVSEVGKSVTQYPNEYVFKHENTLIKLMDTPGLMDTGDTSDHSVDKEHISNILRLLSSYDEIHAICILLKAGESRLSKAFEYTLTEILRYIDRDARDNVIFIFTHAACTNFKPDKTQSILQMFLKENKLHVPLPPDRPTIYCFENDTMQYLALCKNKIPQTEDDQEDAQRNWNKSVRSTTGMISYVCRLTPHSLAGIKEIYSAEHTIGVLSKLLLETLLCVFKDVDDMESKKKEAEDLKEQISKHPEDYAQHDFKEILFIPETKVLRKELGYMNVVCEGPKCSIVAAGNIVYPQTCCENCGKSWKFWCDKMTWGSLCKVCGCDKSKHEWRTTKTEIFTEYKRDETVIKKIVDSSSALQEINRSIAECENQVKMCKEETEQMLRTCAKLNIFLCKNALMEHNDELSKILKNKIQTYETADAKTAPNLEYLKQIQRQYNHFWAKERNNHHNVRELVQQLYRLPMRGNELKTAMEKEERARQTAIEIGRKSNKMMVV